MYGPPWRTAGQHVSEPSVREREPRPMGGLLDSRKPAFFRFRLRFRSHSAGGQLCQQPFTEPDSSGLHVLRTMSVYYGYRERDIQICYDYKHVSL